MGWGEITTGWWRVGLGWGVLGVAGVGGSARQGKRAGAECGAVLRSFVCTPLRVAGL